MWYIIQSFSSSVTSMWAKEVIVSFKACFIPVCSPAVGNKQAGAWGYVNAVVIFSTFQHADAYQVFNYASTLTQGTAGQSLALVQTIRWIVMIFCTFMFPQKFFFYSFAMTLASTNMLFLFSGFQKLYTRCLSQQLISDQLQVESWRIKIPKTDVPSIIFIFPLPASCTCHSSGDSTAAARRPPSTDLVWRLIGQHAGAASVRPEPTGSSNVLKGKLFSLSEASCRTGELTEWIYTQNHFSQKYVSSINFNNIMKENLKVFGECCSLTKSGLFPRAGCHGSWKGVASRALCVQRVWDWIRQPQLLREGWTTVLRVGLLHALLPPLCTMQQAHSKCERRGCACVV